MNGRILYQNLMTLSVKKNAEYYGSFTNQYTICTGLKQIFFSHFTMRILIIFIQMIKERIFMYINLIPIKLRLIFNHPYPFESR